MALHGITKSRLERLQKCLLNGNSTPPLDRRGKHDKRVNKIPDEITRQIHAHILSFPRYTSHYSRKDNLKHYYLSPLLNISKLYDLYLQKYEPDHHKLQLEDKNSIPIVKYEYYRKYFSENFKISFGKPKTDTCQQCDKLLNKIDAAESEEAKDTLEREKILHIKKAETFYDDIKEKTAIAKSNPEVEVLTVDFQQNLPLPVSSTEEVFYKIQLWVFNFCIHLGSTGKSYFYVYDETQGGKGQNEVISMLFHFVKNHMPSDVKELYIFSDNCSSQNKNYMLVQFLYSLVELNRFRLIVHRYPEPGHSFLPCDRSFGLIEINKRKYDKIFVPNDYVQIIKTTSKKFIVIPVTQDLFLDFKNLQIFFVKHPSRKNNKFTLSKYRIVCYKKTDSKTVLETSETVSWPVFFSFDLKNNKVSNPIVLPDDNAKLYSGRRPLKKNKFDHVMTLAKNYVPSCDQWFYQDIERYHKSFQPDDRATSVSEYSSDE